MAITINGNGTITGINVGGLPNGIVNTAMLANNAVTVDKASGTVKGITEVDQWRVTSDFTMGQYAATITSNWERNDTEFERIGTGFSAPNSSNGHWTFPSTGKWLIQVQWTGRRASGNTYYGFHYCHAMNDGNQSNGFDICTSYVGNGSNENINTAFMQAIFDVKDVSTHKVLFGYYDWYTQTTVYMGHTGKNENSYTFLKLGET